MSKASNPYNLHAFITAGRPGTTEDVRSFLQAASYNAKYTFDHQETQTYEEMTKPLRELMVKDEQFS